jgi:hypothetical protein
MCSSLLEAHGRLYRAKCHRPVGMALSDDLGCAGQEAPQGISPFSVSFESCCHLAKKVGESVVVKPALGLI